jgi:hypothetical protein
VPALPQGVVRNLVGDIFVGLVELAVTWFMRPLFGFKAGWIFSGGGGAAFASDVISRRSSLMGLAVSDMNNYSVIAGGFPTSARNPVCHAHRAPPR